MITENYVSFEIAKLLKEKGFNEPSNHLYIEDRAKCRRKKIIFDKDNNINWNDNNFTSTISAPTFQMVMKWLREKFYYHIMIDCLGSENYLPTIQQINSSKDYKVEGTKSKIMGNGFDSYKEAVEAAIKYCLINLI